MDIVPAMEIPTDRVSYYFGETRLQLILDQKRVSVSIFFDFYDLFLHLRRSMRIHLFLRHALEPVYFLLG